jgi:hypothetical protein
MAPEIIVVIVWTVSGFITALFARKLNEGYVKIKDIFYSLFFAIFMPLGWVALLFAIITKFEKDKHWQNLINKKLF